MAEKRKVRRGFWSLDTECDRHHHSTFGFIGNHSRVSSNAGLTTITFKCSLHSFLSYSVGTNVFFLLTRLPKEEMGRGKFL